MSLSLPAHADTSSMSFTVALNSHADGAFEGGGTWFRALDAVVDADVGQAVAFAGPLRHAGHPITCGTRMILVLFMYVDGFNYGRLLGWDKAGNHSTPPDGSEGNGKVDGCSNSDGDHGGDCDGSDGCGTKSVKLTATTDPGGFVVYNETHELMSMLDNEVVASN